MGELSIRGRRGGGALFGRSKEAVLQTNTYSDTGITATADKDAYVAVFANLDYADIASLWKYTAATGALSLVCANIGEANIGTLSILFQSGTVWLKGYSNYYGFKYRICYISLE